MNRVDWSHTAEQLLRHWQRSGITHIPVSRSPLPESIAAWTKPQAASAAPAIASPSPPSVPRTVESVVPPPEELVSGLHHLPQQSLVLDSSVGESTSVGTSWSVRGLSENERADTLKALNDEIVACRKCTEIVCRRTQTVFGIGPLRPKLVMFGEAPGAEEDRAGEPFVGPAGQLLDRILVASGLARDQVYIMNTLKCRPPNNRTPTDIEMENCRPFFERQLDILQPEYIVCWGAVAARAILKTSDSIGRLRGRFHSYKQAKVMITYHPAYLLRTPEAKRLTWEDMKMLMRELGIPVRNSNT
jgi:uracil-DNA glycosylase